VARRTSKEQMLGHDISRRREVTAPRRTCLRERATNGPIGNHAKPNGETDMIRKTVIALAAVAAIGTVALAPTAASAKGIGFGFGHHHHHHHGVWGFGWGYADGDDACYLVKKPTRYGYKWVTVCS
jgi:hypothetical protein